MKNKTYHVNQLFMMLENLAETVIFQHGTKKYLGKQCIADIVTFQKTLPLSGERLALCFKDRYTFFIALLATLSNKLEPVLLPNNQFGSLKSLESEYDAVLTDMSSISEQSEKKCIFTTFAENENKTELGLYTKDLSPTQRIIFFTSGSTGQPKKVFRTLAQLSNEINQLEILFGSCMHGPVFTTVSHQHVYGLLFHLLWPLCSERLIQLQQLNYPEQIIDVFNNTDSLILITSPAILKRMYGLSAQKTKMTVFSSGGLLSQSVAKSIYESFGIYPIEIFGSTETSAVAYRTQDNTTGWKAFQSVELKMNPETKCLMIIKSPFFDCKEVVTMGDMAYFNNDGSFELLGRADRIVKIEEKRVSLTEIENLLKTDELVQQAYALRLEESRQYIAAIIALTRKGQALLETMGKSYLNKRLKKLLSECVEALALPKKFRYVDEIPENSQGKHIPEALKKLFEPS